MHRYWQLATDWMKIHEILFHIADEMWNKTNVAEQYTSCARWEWCDAHKFRVENKQQHHKHTHTGIESKQTRLSPTQPSLLSSETNTFAFRTVSVDVSILHFTFIRSFCTFFHTTRQINTEIVERITWHSSDNLFDAEYIRKRVSVLVTATVARLREFVVQVCVSVGPRLIPWFAISLELV